MFIVGFLFIDNIIKSSVPPKEKTLVSPEVTQKSDNELEDTLEVTWSRINKKNVEKVCLSETKKEAVDQGYPDFSVSSCSCTTKEEITTKEYSCTISALDGSHPISIKCLKSDEECEIITEEGKQSISFEEIEKYDLEEE